MTPSPAIEELFNGSASYFEVAYAKLGKKMVMDAAYAAYYDELYTTTMCRELLQLMASRGGKVGVALSEAAISGTLRSFFLDFERSVYVEDESDEKIYEMAADQLVETVHVSLQV